MQYQKKNTAYKIVLMNLWEEVILEAIAEKALVNLIIDSFAS